ncbi:hypothetical protein E2C01_008378 [Portunus trituberculatus]|uniref:Uncharacterized protein n=1 Tax=Portunus trituberculatus TaxID=210409 RepID=A0A5B7D1Q0_PORTR|nr:hypothetical protein [Portunus trituberculatus]
MTSLALHYSLTLSVLCPTTTVEPSAGDLVFDAVFPSPGTCCSTYALQDLHWMRFNCPIDQQSL